MTTSSAIQDSKVVRLGDDDDNVGREKFRTRFAEANFDCALEAVEELEEKFLFGRILFPAFFVATLVAQAAAPERKVQGNVIVSERDPKVRIELPKLAQYVGADRWVLYGIADCELHIYAENLEPSRLQAAELDKCGKAHDRWSAIEKGLVKRAVSTIQIEQL